MNNCEACHHSAIKVTGDDDDEETPVLECRRYPPAVLVIDGELFTMWPQVTSDDGCGEFMP